MDSVVGLPAGRRVAEFGWMSMLTSPMIWDNVSAFFLFICAAGVLGWFPLCMLWRSCLKTDGLAVGFFFRPADSGSPLLFDSNIGSVIATATGSTISGSLWARYLLRLRPAGATKLLLFLSRSASLCSWDASFYMDTPLLLCDTFWFLRPPPAAWTAASLAARVSLCRMYSACMFTSYLNKSEYRKSSSLRLIYRTTGRFLIYFSLISRYSSIFSYKLL